MPLCWIFLLKRRSALSKVSFSPTRTSANPESPPTGTIRDHTKLGSRDSERDARGRRDVHDRSSSARAKAGAVYPRGVPAANVPGTSRRKRHASGVCNEDVNPKSTATGGGYAARALVGEIA